VRHARFVFGVALEDAAAMSPGGQCVSFKIAPRMLTSSGSLVETQGELEIVNTGSAVSVGDEVVAISDLTGFWTRLEATGGAGQYVTFEFADGPETSSSGSSSESSEDELPDDCDARIEVSGRLFGKVLSKACGMEGIPGENSDGLIQLEDDLGILDNRDYRDILGRIGYAVRMEREESGSVESSNQGDCYWMIVIVNFWRVVQVVSDIVFGEDTITIKRKNLTVWDDCALPDEVIEGTDCPTGGSSSSGSAS
jgi:hypothetical protein